MTSISIKLPKSLKELLKNNHRISDIILFGSAARGKEKPNDVDVLVLFKESVDKATEYKIRKELEKHYKGISTISKTEKDVFDESFDARESILFEGKSLITGRGLAGRHGFHSFGMFKYNFSGWDKLKKTKFYYALNGRLGKRGIAEMLDCIKLSDLVILAPVEKVEMFREFLNSWKINYIYIPTLIPERLSREKILKSS
jgi:predicted nucleotidyltransferase